MVPYRGVMPGHGGPVGRHASRDISRTLLVLFLGRKPVMWEGRCRGTRREEHGNLSLKLFLSGLGCGVLGQEDLEPLIDRVIHRSIRHTGQRSRVFVNRRWTIVVML